MSDLTNVDNESLVEDNNVSDILAVTDELLLDVRKEELPKDKTIKLPIKEIGKLGAGVASIVPNIEKITSKTNVTDGLYRLVNMEPGDKLKASPKGFYWGAIKKEDGGSKMLKLNEANPISAESVVTKINPSTMMMAVALFSIEQELSKIDERTQKIITFLETEKESEIEADVVTLVDIINKYKHNWDNKHYVTSNHKMVCDIQRTARKNILFFQKQIGEIVNSKGVTLDNKEVKSKLKDLTKKFKYYRLSLYSFGLGTLLEIMLSENYLKDNIEENINIIKKNAMDYRELFTNSSKYLEKIAKDSVETNVLKGVGGATKSVGKFFGGVPLIKDTPIDDALVGLGKKTTKNAKNVSKEIVEKFSKVSKPGTKIFVDKLTEMEIIYNTTKEICFDSDNIYLVA